MNCRVENVEVLGEQRIVPGETNKKYCKLEQKVTYRKRVLRC